MQPKKNGFTLLEILVALFIFTLVALMLTKALHQVIKTHDATEKSAAQLSEIQMALLLFSRDIEQAVDRPITTAKRGIEEALIGSKTKLRFTHLGFANPDGSVPSSALQRVSYSFEQGQFIRATASVLDGDPNPPHSRVLLTKINQAYFRFLDQQNNFHLSWPPEGDSQKLPRAVEITLVLDTGDQLQQLYPLPQQQVSHAIS